MRWLDMAPGSFLCTTCSVSVVRRIQLLCHWLRLGTAVFILCPSLVCLLEAAAASPLHACQAESSRQP